MDEANLPKTQSPPRLLSTLLLSTVDRYRRWIFAALFLLYAAAFNGMWRVGSDSALYAAIARNLATGQGYTYLGAPDTLVEPGLPWLIAAGFRLFGTQSFVFPLAVIWLSSLATLVLCYRLFLSHAGRPTAVMVVALVGVSETVFQYGYELYTDVPFTTAVMLFLVGYERIVRDDKGWRRAGPWVAVVVATLLMTAIRAVYLTFIGALLLTVAWRLWRGPQRWRHLVMAAAVAACVLAFRAVDPRRQHVDQPILREAMLGNLLTERIAWAVDRTVFHYLPMMAGETTVEAIVGLRLGPGLNQLVFLLVVGLGLLLARRRLLWGLWVAATVTQMLIWLPRERYFLPIMPLVLYALWEGGVWLNARLGPKKGDLALALVMVLLVVPNAVLSVRYVVEQRRTPFYATYDDGRAQRNMDLARALVPVTTADDLLMADDARVLAYFSDRTVIASPLSLRIPPNDRQLEAFRAKLAAATRLLVVEDGKDTQRTIDRLGLKLGEPLLEKDGVKVRPATVPATVPASTAPAPHESDLPLGE